MVKFLVSVTRACHSNARRYYLASCHQIFKDKAEDVVVNGPSDDVLRFGSSMYYSGNQFWDDGLTEDEADLICSVYKLYSKYRIYSDLFLY